MNPDTGRFEPVSEAQAEIFTRFTKRLTSAEEEENHELIKAWKRHGITEAQMFSRGEVVEIKGARYRVKSIHEDRVVFVPDYPK